jgi:serine phosphatase RsbU (regulator of sigma subunit)
VAILDSVGHDLDSSLVSHLVQGSLRNSRRRGLDLPAAYTVADEALGDLYPDQRFATAAFGHLDLGSGRFRWISAGHPAPLVVRGTDVAGEAPTVPTTPIGLRHTNAPDVNEVVLDRGDAVVLYTDGVTEGGVRGASGSASTASSMCWAASSSRACRPRRSCAGSSPRCSSTRPTSSTTTWAS